MTLDGPTLDALGYGDPWQQLALRFGVYAVVDRERKTAWQRDARRAAGVRPDAVARAAAKHPTEEARRDAIRRSKREYMQRMRAKGAA